MNLSQLTTRYYQKYETLADLNKDGGICGTLLGCFVEIHDPDMGKIYGLVNRAEGRGIDNQTQLTKIQVIDCGPSRNDTIELTNGISYTVRPTKLLPADLLRCCGLGFGDA